MGYRRLIADELLNGLDLQHRIDRWHRPLADPTMTVRVVDGGGGQIGRFRE